jgi:hypothetical protein
MKPISAVQAEPPTSSLPSFPASNIAVSPTSGSRVPGYYVLESAAMNQPRYVYWGPEPPRFA